MQAFLELPLEREPGTEFVYSGGASYMLSAIIQKLTGLPLLEYLTPRLFEPLGIRGAEWGACPRGISIGSSGLRLKTEDIARFGQLYLQRGRWNDAQLLPEAWVKEATAAQVSTGRKKMDYNQGYGYQFWRCRHGAYRGDGAQGQFCIVMPEQDAVIVTTAGVSNLQELLDLIWEHLLPGMGEIDARS